MKIEQTLEQVDTQIDAQIARSHAHVIRSMIALGLDPDHFEPLQVYAISGGRDRAAADACWAEIERRIEAGGARSQ